jgi:hypothetical protein
MRSSIYMYCLYISVPRTWLFLPGYVIRDGSWYPVLLGSEDGDDGSTADGKTTIQGGEYNMSVCTTFIFSRLAKNTICACVGKASFYVHKQQMTSLSTSTTSALITMCLLMCLKHTLVIGKHHHIKCIRESYSAKYVPGITRSFNPTMHYTQGFLGYPRNRECLYI